jgi:site-specific DNA-cytosine methylase
MVQAGVGSAKSSGSNQMQTLVAEGCLTPWDTQQARVFTPEGTAPTLAGADGGGGRNPGGVLFTAGFCAGAAPTAGGIGYQEERAPTLKAAESGTNMVPSILCLNDQGGSVMECTENMTGTLRAQEHGHQPLVYENHGIDARYTGPHAVAPTLSARYGTGGNNIPLVTQTDAPITDHHAVFSRQRVDVFKDDGVVSTQSARQHKDATDLVCQPVSEKETVDILLIRRLTPLECERLQGFPDGWTDIPGASDSARYKALGNSVAIPCVEYVMRGIVMAAK